MATTRGIFDTFEMNNQLTTTWQKRKAEVEAERLQPYADLLLDNIVWPSILAQKDAIFASLKEKCETSTEKMQLCVPVWTFSHVYTDPYVKVGLALSTERERYIYEMGLRQFLRVEDHEEFTTLRQRNILDIVKKTKFCQQLAKRFGRSYIITVSPSTLQEHIDSSGASFYSQTMALKLNFFPYGLPEALAEKRREYESAGPPLTRLLQAGEKLIYWCGEGDERTVLGPPLQPAPVRLLGSNPCYCGCAHDDDSEEE